MHDDLQHRALQEKDSQGLYTMSTANQFVDQGITFLRAQICKLEAFKGTKHDVGAALEHAQEVWKDKGWIWLLSESALLDGEVSIDFLVRGECQVVTTYSLGSNMALPFNLNLACHVCISDAECRRAYDP